VRVGHQHQHERPRDFRKTQGDFFASGAAAGGTISLRSAVGGMGSSGNGAGAIVFTMAWSLLRLSVVEQVLAVVCLQQA
jgi:hypothetical protein